MARKITIPITDHNSHCSTGYTVSYKLSGETIWTTEPYFIPPIELSNLQDNTVYNIRIVRKCCDGIESAPLELTINTTLLDTPDNFVATAGDTEISLDWDDVTGADSYTLERADDAAFTTNLEVVYTGTNTAIMDTGLTNGETYYYRVKATAQYHMDSGYATTNETPTV